MQHDSTALTDVARADTAHCTICSSKVAAFVLDLVASTLEPLHGMAARISVTNYQDLLVSKLTCVVGRYDYVNVTIRDTVVLDAHGGLNVQTRGPGSVRNLTVTNLVVSHAIFDAPCKPWMGNAQPVAISADRWCGGPAPCDEDGGPPAGTITVRFSRLRAAGDVLQLICLWSLS